MDTNKSTSVMDFTASEELMRGVAGDDQWSSSGLAFLREVEARRHLGYGNMMDLVKNLWHAKLRVVSAGFNHAAAPWPDYAGEMIHVGDTIRHPDGDEGTVVYFPEKVDPGEQWRVDYGDGIPFRLALQVGEKGQAVVVRKGAE